jgi:hypothetical protein
VVNALGKSKCTHFGIFETLGSYNFDNAECRLTQCDPVWSMKIYIEISLNYKLNFDI